jgi:ABC-2 type transport system ATP-binding protein
MTNILDLIGLQKAYGKNIVLFVESLAIREKEFVGIVGNNGAGKTTMLSLILDLIKPTKGFIKSKTRLVSNTEDWKKYTGSYLNENFLIPFLTPIEFLEFIGSLYGKTSKDIYKFLEDNSSFNTKEFYTKKYIRELSSGNKTKLGLLASIISDPEMLILDEPFLNLDPSSQSWLKTKLKNLNENGVTILLSSHDLKHVTEICTRILLLENGIIIKDLCPNNDTLVKLENYFHA